MTDTTAAWATTVYANHCLFGLHDPTCEEISNYAEATSAISKDAVGWSTNALLVESATDLAPLGVQVEVVQAAPPTDDSAELLREGQLELPGGQVSIPESVDGDFQVGLPLPPGPGTYGVRVAGYGRRRVRELRDAAVEPDDIYAVAEAQVGIERYRISLWQISSEPSWPDDDED
ncbi:hypothetical protein [Actinoplanes sp. NPDC089786]|uniref:hypothetical protein n=1 Tax=Actinoplanes sp. NPDC089786 TaxID=3155185 RepID=UPI00341CDB30